MSASSGGLESAQGLSVAIQALPVAYDRLLESDEFASTIRMDSVSLLDANTGRRLSIEEVVSEVQKRERNLQDPSLFLLSIQLFSSGRCSGCSSQFTFGNSINGRRGLQAVPAGCPRIDPPLIDEVLTVYDELVQELSLAAVPGVESLVEVGAPTPAPTPTSKSAKGAKRG